MASDVPEVDQDAQTALQLWEVLNRAQRAIAAFLRRDVERRAMGLTEFAVLEALYREGPLALGEVGERIVLTSGTITYVIDKLEDQGMLRRRACEEDRRRTLAELTEFGRARIARLFPERAALLKRLMSALSVEEKQEVAALLKRLGLFAADAEREGAGEGSRDARA